MCCATNVSIWLSLVLRSLLPNRFFVNNRQVANNTNLSSLLSFANIRPPPSFKIGYSTRYCQQTIGQLFKSTKLPLIYKNSKQNSCSAVEYFGEGHRAPADRGFYHKTAGLDILCFIVLINEFLLIRTSNSKTTNSLLVKFLNYCRRNGALSRNFLEFLIIFKQLLLKL